MNILVAQSGGPTSVINSSLAGVIQAGIDNNFTKIYASKHGIEGILEDDIVEINKQKFIEKNARERLKSRPSSILGSCRFRLPNDIEDEIYVKIFNKFKKYDINSFVYIGGNDSMDTVMKLNQYMKKNNIDWINVVGSPKTIDNDLTGMDHSPGFSSASKYILNTIRNIRTDVDIYNKKTITFVEIMGRNAGWLAASTLFLNYGREKNIVNLVYLSEKSISIEKIIDDIKREHEREKNLIVVISEGFMDENRFFEQKIVRSYDQGFNHPIISGIAQRISDYIYKIMDIKTKAVELNISQRTNHMISITDSEEAYSLGYESVRLSKNHTNLVPVLERKSDEPYIVEMKNVESNIIANKEKMIPLEWLENNEILYEKITKYLLPLVQGEREQFYENGILDYIELKEFIV